MVFHISPQVLRDRFDQYFDLFIFFIWMASHQALIYATPGYLFVLHLHYLLFHKDGVEQVVEVCVEILGVFGEGVFDLFYLQEFIIARGERSYYLLCLLFGYCLLQLIFPQQNNGALEDEHQQQGCKAVYSLYMIQPLFWLPFEYSRIQKIADFSKLIFLDWFIEDDQIQSGEAGEVEAESIGLEVYIIDCGYKCIVFDYFKEAIQQFKGSLYQYFLIIVLLLELRQFYSQAFALVEFALYYQVFLLPIFAHFGHYLLIFKHQIRSFCVNIIDILDALLQRLSIDFCRICDIDKFAFFHLSERWVIVFEYCVLFFRYDLLYNLCFRLLFHHQFYIFYQQARRQCCVLGFLFGSVELLFVMSKFYLFVYYIRMGAVLYKADFLYPHREPPTWAINDDVGPYHMQNNVKNSSQPPKPLQSPVIQQESKPRRLPSPQIYDDYSEISEYYNQSLHNSVSTVKQQQIDSRLKKKIILLPAQNSGPIVVHFHQCAPGELKENSLEDIQNKFNESRKSSVISINSHESMTIIKKKSLMPTIKQILEDTPVEQCPRYMEKSREAWRLQNYQKCIEYLQLGLDACQKEHPVNYYEKGLYHKRLGSNYWRLYNEQQAINHLRQARTFFQLQIDPDLREIAAVENNLGIIFQQQNNLQESLDHFLKSLELKRQFLPETHVQISKALNNIGLLQWSLNKKKEAVDSFGQALHINKISFGYNHHQVAKNYFNLSLCLFDIGEYSLWLDYHFECLKIMRKIGLIRSVDYKAWLKTFQVKLRELLALKRHSQELVIKSLGMMAMILQKDDQIQFMTSIKEDLMDIQ